MNAYIRLFWAFEAIQNFWLQNEWRFEFREMFPRFSLLDESNQWLSHAVLMRYHRNAIGIGPDGIDLTLCQLASWAPHSFLDGR